jgi:hypothetical protein
LRWQQDDSLDLRYEDLPNLSVFRDRREDVTPWLCIEPGTIDRHENVANRFRARAINGTQGRLRNVRPTPLVSSRRFGASSWLPACGCVADALLCRKSRRYGDCGVRALESL